MSKTEFTFPDEQVEDKATTSGASEEFEIEIVDDTPAEDRNREPMKRPVEEPTEEELADHSRSVQNRIRELTRARHDERRRAEKLARENQELMRYLEAVNSKQKQQQDYISMGQQAYIEKSKQAATAVIESSKDKLKQAYEVGDAEAIAKAQEDLTRAHIQLQEANNFRVTPLQERPQQVYTPPQEQRGAQEQPINEEAIEWAANNSDWFQVKGKEDMTDYAVVVHARLAREKGVGFVGSPEYYKEIDSAMRKVFPAHFNGEGDTQKTPASSRPTTVVAPAQRSTRPRKVRLTRTQVEIANRLGVSLEGYAKQVAALENEHGN